jgi:hypothetical protein
MAALGDEEAGGKRESAMCSQTLLGVVMGDVWHGSNVRTTKVECQSQGVGMTTAPAGRAARSLPSHSNLLHLRSKMLLPLRSGRWKGIARKPDMTSFTEPR